MKIYTNNIPVIHYSGLTKTAQIIPEQLLGESVEIYLEAIPYIKCEIKSTIQHEGGHRKSEEAYHQRAAQTINFQDAQNESFGEREEEDCQSLMPAQLSGQTETIYLNHLFEEAKTASNIQSGYRQDVRAGSLMPEAQGMYLMQDAIAIKNQTAPNQYEGFDGTLWVDVRKIAEPWIVKDRQQDDENKARPATFQDDGIQADLPDVSKTPPSDQAISARPFSPVVPAIGGRE